MVDTRDILLKAAEDVQSGMWCKYLYYKGPAENFIPSHLIAGSVDDLELALKSKRCAQGSLGVATKLLGGTVSDYRLASEAVNRRVPLIAFNDELPNDPFEAGQQLAELFRQTAESL